MRTPFGKRQPPPLSGFLLFSACQGLTQVAVGLVFCRDFGARVPPQHGLRLRRPLHGACSAPLRFSLATSTSCWALRSYAPHFYRDLLPGRANWPYGSRVPPTMVHGLSGKR